jgi:hypothetical protein
MTDAATCISCRKTLANDRADTECGVCGEGVCRKCRLFLAEGAFPFADRLPVELKHTYYCGGCFDQHVEPFRERYDEQMEQAKQVNVIYKESKSTIRVLRKADRRLQVTDCPDRDETILRLAFGAARAGFNTLIDVEVSSRKVRNEGYQTSSWSGSGVPAEIKSRELDFG